MSAGDARRAPDPGEAFAFEVPTSSGHIRIVVPSQYSIDEARTVGQKIARIFIQIATVQDVDFSGEIQHRDSR